MELQYNASISRQRLSVPLAEVHDNARECVPVEFENLRDEELLALVVRRHETALGHLYDRYSRMIYAIALRITGDRLTAEEVVQDVFQNVWQTAASFQPGVGSFSAWLMGVARHRAIDATRSKRERSRSAEQPMAEGWEMPDDSNLEQEVDQRELREFVRKALNELPTNQRQTIELAYYGGLTRAEIANKMGEPLGTVKTRMRLGLLKLRDLLRTLEHDDGRDA
ncbi:MAG: sigma-70 family RNA polymerase sigma factor [Roseiflexaceae bacterium]